MPYYYDYSYKQIMFAVTEKVDRHYKYYAIIPPPQ